MSTAKFLNFLFTLQVLTALIMYVNSLPITSKPIESTAENLAWQAWLMLPPEQKNLEKSRKVTPKSIFTLPFRECPPGHHLFENRCIPTVQIDQTALLTQELLGFVNGMGGGGANNGGGGGIGGSDFNYEEFDYDFGSDEGGEIVAEVMYEPAQKLNGEESYDQMLPSRDEPLKFNIFQQKFPTDYENVAALVDSEEVKQQNQNETVATNSSNSTLLLAEAVNGLAASMQNSSNINVELQMEASNMSSNIDKSQHIPKFSISDIDAIAVPASSTTTTSTSMLNGNVDIGSGAGEATLAVGDSVADYLETKKQNNHKFSLFKDDSSVHLVTTTLPANNNNNNNNQNENSKQPDFTQLLKADELLPLPLSNVAASTTTTTSMAGVNEVPKLSTIRFDEGTASSSTFNLLSNSATTNSVEVTTDMLQTTAAETATMPADLAKKIEHARSVIDGADTDAQEINFITTTEAIGTTNFQLDETTIVESEPLKAAATATPPPPAPTIALKELFNLAAATYPAHLNDDEIDRGLRVVKKSKVEPVELPPPIIDETEVVEATTPTKATPTQSTATDRFVNYQQKLNTKTGEQAAVNAVDVDVDKNDEHDDKLKFSNTKTTETTITRMTPTKPAPVKTSEINIVQELRMINELVKGNKPNSNADSNIDEYKAFEHQLKPEIIKSTTESGPATTTVSAFTNVDIESSSIISAKSTTVPDAASSSTSPSTTTIWSKIMPLLDLNEQSAETTNSANINSAQPTTSKSINRFDDASTTASTSPTTQATTTIATSSLTTKYKPNPNNFSNNRSNRNSKIIRINSLSSFSSSTNGKAQTQTQQHQQQHNTNADDKLTLSSPQSSQMVTTPETSTSTTTSSPASNQQHLTTAENVEISENSSSDSNDKNDDIGNSFVVDDTFIDDDASTSKTTIDSESNQSEPFWWLPIGWRLDRANEPSLLLRFWSALPGQGD